MKDSRRFAKRKVLLVEDDPIIAMDLSLQITDSGLDVCGPFHTSEDALDKIRAVKPDFAILDFHLKQDDTSEKVAHCLSKSGIPFVFLSGHSTNDVLTSGAFKDVPCLEKPILNDELFRILNEVAT